MPHIFMCVCAWQLYYVEELDEMTAREKETDRRSLGGLFTHDLVLCCSIELGREHCSEIKFSPNNQMIAAACHDNYIYVYRAKLFHPTLGKSTGRGKALVDERALRSECELALLVRLEGHSSYVAHIGWLVM